MNMKIKSIKCLETRMFYDSTWKIDFHSGESCTIVRDDTESEADLIEAIGNCKTVDDVKRLDMKSRIYYD